MRGRRRALCSILEARTIEDLDEVDDKRDRLVVYWERSIRLYDLSITVVSERAISFDARD